MHLLLTEDQIKTAAKIVVEKQHGSTSLVQRRLKIGYNRACSIMKQLEIIGVLGKADGIKQREVFIKNEDDLQGCFDKIEL